MSHRSIVTPAQQRAALASASLTLALALGIRGNFGLFLAPLALHGVPIGMTAFAIALHNLSWGLAQPLVGAWADRAGTARIQLLGGVLFAAGLALPALYPATWAVVFGIGILTGLGIACTGWGVSLAGLSRCFTATERPRALAIANAGCSAGQLAGPLVTALLLAWGGPQWALAGLALMILPTMFLGYPLDRAMLEPPAPRKSIAAVRGALGEPAFVLLTLGFFTCGFQLSFLSTHLPGYLSLCGMSASAGAWALTIVGAANIVGATLCAHMGGRASPHLTLAGLYTARGVAILIFWLAPKTELSLVLFAVVMGLTWLGTVPLTNSVIARLYGIGDLGALFGMCFISHQIGGFVGAWVGGLVFEYSGSYDIAFAATALAGFTAAAFNLPIRMPVRSRWRVADTGGIQE